MEFTNAVTIRRDVSDVFAFLEDFENIPKWNYAIRETKRTSPGAIGVGTRYEQRRMVPREATETFELIDHRPDERLAIRGNIGPFFGVLTYELAPVPEGTRLINHAALDAPGAGGVLARLGGSRVRDAVSANLEKLRDILEA